MTAKNTDNNQNNLFRQKLTLNVGGRLVDLSVPKVMGILNLTPDSFYDGSRHNSIENALKQTGLMLAEGADFIDIGAYSSRPRAEHISAEDELDRLIPALKAIVKEFPNALISADTFRADVAERAVEAGARLINDISGGGMDEEMFETVVRLNVPYILMHMKGTPQNMHLDPKYEDIFTEVCDYLLEKATRLTDMGAKDLIIDPGFGFGKTMDHNYELLNKFDLLKMLGLPIMAGISRKSMAYKPLNGTAAEALNGTTVLNTVALMKGANILRVHDVKPAVEAVKLVRKVEGLRWKAEG